MYMSKYFFTHLIDDLLSHFLKHPGIHVVQYKADQQHE